MAREKVTSASIIDTGLELTGEWGMHAEDAAEREESKKQRDLVRAIRQLGGVAKVIEFLRDSCDVGIDCAPDLSAADEFEIEPGAEASVRAASKALTAFLAAMKHEPKR